MASGLPVKYTYSHAASSTSGPFLAAPLKIPLMVQLISAPRLPLGPMGVGPRPTRSGLISTSMSSLRYVSRMPIRPWVHRRLPSAVSRQTTPSTIWPSGLRNLPCTSLSMNSYAVTASGVSNVTCQSSSPKSFMARAPAELRIEKKYQLHVTPLPHINPNVPSCGLVHCRAYRQNSSQSLGPRSGSRPTCWNRSLRQIRPLKSVPYGKAQ